MSAQWRGESCSTWTWGCYRATGFGSLSAGYYFFKVERRYFKRQLNEPAMKKKMSPYLRSVEDTSIGDEVDTLPVGQRDAYTCIVIQQCHTSFPLLECRQTCSTASGYGPYSSQAECVHKCSWSQLYLCFNMWPKIQEGSVTRTHRPPSLHIHPSSLIMFASSTMNFTDLLCFWSLAIKRKKKILTRSYINKCIQTNSCFLLKC